MSDGDRYPVEEFLGHLEDLLPERVESDDPFFANLIRIGDYMNAREDDSAEAFFKTSRLVLAMQYLAQDLEAFDREDFLVSGSDEVGALVSEHLFRALHRVYCGELLPAGDVPPEEVMTLARTIRDEGAQ